MRAPCIPWGRPAPLEQLPKREGHKSWTGPRGRAGGGVRSNQTARKIPEGCSVYFRGDWARVSTPPPGRMARLSAGSPATDAGVVNYVMVEMAMTTG
jgi:hypothetical protein